MKSHSASTFRVCWVDILLSFYSLLEECLLEFVCANFVCKFVNKLKGICDVAIAEVIGIWWDTIKKRVLSL